MVRGQVSRFRRMALGVSKRVLNVYSAHTISPGLSQKALGRSSRWGVGGACLAFWIALCISHYERVLLRHSLGEDAYMAAVSAMIKVTDCTGVPRS